MAFPKDTVGMAVLGPVLLRADLLGSHVGLGARGENSQEKGLEGLSSAFRRAPEMPPVPGAGGQLVLLLALDNCALGDSILGFGMGGAGGRWNRRWRSGGGGDGGLVGGSSGTEGTGGFAELCAVSPCPPGVTQPGIHGLRRGFRHRHRWELPLLHPEGTGSSDGTGSGTAPLEPRLGRGSHSSPLPQLCSLQFYFLRLFKIKASDGSGAPGSLSGTGGGGHRDLWSLSPGLSPGKGCALHPWPRGHLDSASASAGSSASASASCQCQCLPVVLCDHQTSPGHQVRAQGQGGHQADTRVTVTSLGVASMPLVLPGDRGGGLLLGLSLGVRLSGD